MKRGKERTATVFGETGGPGWIDRGYGVFDLVVWLLLREGLRHHIHLKSDMVTNWGTESLDREEKRKDRASATRCIYRCGIPRVSHETDS